MKYSEIKNLFKQIDDPVLRLELVMDLGNKLTPIPNSAECKDVLSCASSVQICQKDGVFYGTSDSALVRGIIAICISMANDGVKNLKEEFDGLDINLGAGRLTGLDGIIKAINN